MAGSGLGSDGTKACQRVVEASLRSKRVPHATEVIVDLLDQPLIRRAHCLPDLVAHEIRALLLEAVRGEDRVCFAQLARVAGHRQALVQRVARVIGCRRNIGPVRLDIG